MKIWEENEMNAMSESVHPTLDPSASCTAHPVWAHQMRPPNLPIVVGTKSGPSVRSDHVRASDGGRLPCCAALRPGSLARRGGTARFSRLRSTSSSIDITRVSADLSCAGGSGGPFLRG